MHSDSLRRALVASLAVLALAALPAAAQEAPRDPAAAAADEAARQAQAAAVGPRFVPSEAGYAGCVGEPPEAERVQPTVPPGFTPRPGMNGGPGWQVSAPRGWPGPTRPGDQAALTLRDKLGTGNRMVYADVFRPDGAFARAGSILFDDGQAKLTYPSSFSSGAPLVPGTYTVVWRDTITDRFIACDGFVVTP